MRRPVAMSTVLHPDGAQDIYVACEDGTVWSWAGRWVALGPPIPGSLEAVAREAATS